jgi:predicted GNAT family acetyltransferase
MTCLVNAVAHIPAAEAGSSRAVPLAAGHETEVLNFFAARPLHTVIMAGYVLDHGLEGDSHRGTFYACRDAAGRLEGVALVGQVTMMEVRSAAAVRAFARVAQRYHRARTILGEQGQVKRFWRHYAPGGQPVRSASHEILLELSRPPEEFSPVELRLATPGDLDQVMPAHARLTFDVSGVNPLETDPDGFRERTLRRIERRRTWLLEERGRLMFKADVVADTRRAIYLEGIYIRPEERGRGLGTRCVSQLARHLLQRALSICLFVGEQNQAARSCYRKVGFTERDRFDAIYLRPKDAPA